MISPTDEIIACLDATNSPKQTQSKTLLDICSAIELFHTPDNEGFATIAVNSHKENWPLRSKGFRGWIRKSFFDKTNSSPSSQAVEDTLSTLEGKAQFKGPESEVYLRVACFDETVYIDLADDAWRCVEVTKDGWRVLDNSPVKFRRPKGMLPIPEPRAGDPIEYIKRLRALLNMETDDDFKLIVSFIMCAFTNGPYPVLVPNGEQGTGKSTLVRAIRSLVDPNSSPLRREPKNADDLMVGAKNNWIVAFDNVSRLSDELSDDICRLSTGGGLSKRELYTDDGEIVLNAKRPCILNGIEEFVTRGDLADRSIVLSLPVIPEEERVREEIFWKSFEEARPGLLGAICTAISIGIRDKNTFKLSKSPRLADAFHWVSSVETAFGWPRESCVTSLFANQVRSTETVVSSSPLFKAIYKYAKQNFEGAPQLLLDNIKSDASQSELKYLPANAISLGNKLRRLCPSAKKLGVYIAFSRTGSQRKISLRMVEDWPVIDVTLVTDTRRFAPSYDVNDDDDGNFSNHPI